MKNMRLTFIFASIAIFLSHKVSAQQKLLRVVVAGLNHDHVHNILHQYKEGHVEIVGIAEPDKKLWQRFGKSYHLPDSIFYPDLKKLILLKKPDAVLGYNPVGEHVNVVEICAPLHVPVMVEKPLAATLQQAKRIEQLAKQYNIQVLTNYETTWYPSYQEVFTMVRQDSIGSIRKMVVHDGHQGPKEIGCSSDFLAWLTDPVLNGAGALNDFGCYGADLMTWFMKGQKPIAVTAIARHYKPAVYPKVEDDATILVEYPGATGQIEASWNWPFSIKDLEIFGDHGYYHAKDANAIDIRMRENRRSDKIVAALPQPINDPLVYLAAVLHHQIDGENDQASLKYNMIVMQILDAAKRSVKEGKRIVL
ncbi:Gfo/Idh/MocA family protein [Mucilaginibacter sp. KACC 22063]|uniref:Gfo/Idh/MocA family protein n=1 Tax=Mucilaginibacter sp. KACC 22063 TaxID=3025666 RepID=UPI002367041E|nr:Gfo/Idh/MocA family oxidoreductase [Mucilaginibacter sp. KACC 22063]WDF56173.1 Gfo/Idh/MocA family oxidoreductase [Mucilaginibacter sp. KACC 22063]